jgi:hypothetical protein
MSTAIAAPWDPTRLPPLPLHRFTVEEYHRMIASGALDEERRVELLEGWIVSKRNYGVGESVPVSLDGQEIGAIGVASLFAE